MRSTGSITFSAPTDTEVPASDLHDGELLQRAEQFAVELTSTLHTAFGDQVDPLKAGILPGSATSRVTVSQDPETGIELRVNDVPRLQLTVSYNCVWDRAAEFLAVDKANIAVRAINVGEPLFRYEFLRKPTGGLPCAHLHVHARRDALTHLMVLSGEGSQRGKRRKEAVHRLGGVPRMSELHFPLGGIRFRPCVEDVLHMLVDEFGVGTPDNALEVLAAGREEWRRTQLRAAVRDCPQAAAEVLTGMGCQVTPPEAGHPGDRHERLRGY